MLIPRNSSQDYIGSQYVLSGVKKVNITFNKGGGGFIEEENSSPKLKGV
jgi:hypothetical protein